MPAAATERVHRHGHPVSSWSARVLLAKQPGIQVTRINVNARERAGALSG